jgi:type IV pilus assembly protein PilF
MKQSLSLALIGLSLAACTSDRPPEVAEGHSTADLYVLKAVQYIGNGRLDVAKQDLERALELDDKNVEAHNAMGVLYERLDQPQRAEEEYKRALSLDAHNMDVAVNYGRLLCSQSQYEQAMKYFRPVMEDKLYRTPWLVLTNVGICLKKQGQTHEAEEHLRRALEVHPGFPPALLEMAKLSLENGNAMSARAFLQRYESVGPATAESLWFGVQTERALGNNRDANLYLKRLRRYFPESVEARRTHPDQDTP